MSSGGRVCVEATYIYMIRVLLLIQVYQDSWRWARTIVCTCVFSQYKHALVRRVCCLDTSPETRIQREE